ncbi:hypothetical protein [Terrabacter sp. NPDC000476]|uniref:hypothetical protein n=1 Tax=Terrabacter sp. NPDC000476 TaxID=3154258 RepID=UPI00331ED57B
MTDHASSPPAAARPGTTLRPHEAQPQSSDGSWVARRRRRATDDAARRLHDDLVARGITVTRSASGTAVTVLASLVLAAAAVVVGLLVWATVARKGLWGWLGVVAGWAFVAALVPRPVRLGETVRLEPDDFPATHRLVADLAEAVGAHTPAAVHLDAGWGVEVVAVGWTRRPTLVVGLPLWTCLTDDERVPSSLTSSATSAAATACALRSSATRTGSSTGSRRC